jgi:hypothetical protein
MQAFPNNEISEIMKLEGNNKCMDCQAENPTFTSVNNAIFLCEACSKIHKRLGENISKVKSLLSDEFTPEEIAVLKIGGNTRLVEFLKEYEIKEEHNKVYKYHLKLAEYYRSLLTAEANKEKNAEEYEKITKAKPSLEIGLQVMETLSAENLKLMNSTHTSEFAQDMSNIAGKIGSFFSSISKKVNETAKKYGITQKFDDTRKKFNEEVKSFGEKHPSIQNAVTKTGEAFTTAKNYTADKLNKIIESDTMKNVTGKINTKYTEVVNSETMKNIEKKTSEGYHNLKIKAGLKPSDNAENKNENQEQKQEEPKAEEKNEQNQESK